MLVDKSFRNKTKMRLTNHLNRNWDPVAALLIVALKCSRIILILASLSVVLWQVYDVTKTYLSQPVSTELQVVPLNDIPNIHMSICKRFEIFDCKFICKVFACRVCNAQQIPPAFSNLTKISDFWSSASDKYNKTSYRLRDWIDYIKVWSDALIKWNVVYDRMTFSLEEEEAMFTMQMYPFYENFTLLCYTFKEDVRTLSPRIKLQRRGDEKFLSSNNSVS
jgi:hypothetical protein